MKNYTEISIGDLGFEIERFFPYMLEDTDLSNDSDLLTKINKSISGIPEIPKIKMFTFKKEIRYMERHSNFKSYKMHSFFTETDDAVVEFEGNFVVFKYCGEIFIPAFHEEVHLKFLTRIIQLVFDKCKYYMNTDQLSKVVAALYHLKNYEL